MEKSLPCLASLADGSLLLRLHVQPRSSSSSLAGLQGDMLKLRLTAPPIDGKANKAVIAFLAKLCHLPKSAFTLKSGHQGRNKTLIINGMELQTLQNILMEHLQQTDHLPTNGDNR